MERDIDGLVKAAGASTGFMVERSLVMEWYDKVQGRLGHASIVWNGPIVHWEGLWVNRNGTLGGFTDTLPGFFRDHGVERVTAIGLRHLAWRYLGAIGFEPIVKAPEWFDQDWRDAVGLPIFRLDDPNAELFVLDLRQPCRADEYAAWKRGDISEPSWHQVLTQLRETS